MLKTGIHLKLLVVTSLFLLLFPKAHAIDEFKTEYFVTYDVQEDGSTQVFQEIEITNLKNDVVATNYSLTVKQMNIFDIQASDNQGALEIVEEFSEGKAVIKAKFNENVIGKGRANKIKFNYKTNDILSKVGEIYSIRIPKISGLDAVRTYDVKLKIPKMFGPKIFATPHPDYEEEGDFIYTLEFSKDTLEDKGISASFGKYQIINYKLIYQLKNDSSVANIQEIALPPDIPKRQQVDHDLLVPEPVNIYEDGDGNLIAQYRVLPDSSLDITLTGSARILGKQINPEFGGTFGEIPQDIFNNYTQEKRFWEVNAPEIQALKNKLFDEELNVTQNAQKIYNYIVSNLEYDHTVIEKDYVERYGAVRALQEETPSACMEFTDLFIALARSMGIPARELDGYSINIYENANLPLSIKLKSGDLLHAWPEFYDPEFGWVPVDPTWGKTSGLDFFSKLDNTHFVFSIKGMDSEFPLPAGIYRTDNNKNLVTVDISQEESDEKFKHYLTLYKSVTLNPYQLFKGNRKFYAKNEGGTYIYNFYGNKVLPYQVQEVYLNNNLEKINFADINGVLITQNIVLVDKNPKQYFYSPFTVIFSLLIGLLLCGFLYYLLIVRDIRKKLLPRRFLRPRGQDQKRNQR